ncbi:NADPH-cytochrome P450 reductase [Puccinia graminis f. sp. tritici]|uniref:NADPH-cytochrome P450 reductase n=1 Tax=Puccinia graminis f. sp. tritici TaxID=56615 RepID=A0A5B0RTT5_PUCGR|nr:NADPH-cytochrome P450 reductase [Puccinia graminis f. sp. tritici]
MIIEQKGYIFICGDGKSMVKCVEESLKTIFESTGTKNGAAELKFLKDRNRLLLSRNTARQNLGFRLWECQFSTSSALCLDRLALDGPPHRIRTRLTARPILGLVCQSIKFVTPKHRA